MPMIELPKEIDVLCALQWGNVELKRSRMNLIDEFRNVIMRRFSLLVPGFSLSLGFLDACDPLFMHFDCLFLLSKSLMLVKDDALLMRLYLFIIHMFHSYAIIRNIDRSRLLSMEHPASRTSGESWERKETGVEIREPGHGHGHEETTGVSSMAFHIPYALGLGILDVLSVLISCSFSVV